MDDLSTYDIITLDIASPSPAEAKILLIYTGGTFGMGEDESGVLVPFDFRTLLNNAPVLKELPLQVTVISFKSPIDSSNINPNHWSELGMIIKQSYEDHDGFVILHGTDTMAFTASALSFLLEGLKKPVILTGAQLPITAVRTDARDNLITALEIASLKNDKNEPLVPEVCIYFDHRLLRGNRAQKVQSSQFDAFNSGNYPLLARSGIEIEFDYANIMEYQADNELKIDTCWSNDVAVIKLFPGIKESILSEMMGSQSIEGMVLETFGMGNAMDTDWFVDLVKTKIEKGIFIMNVSQCYGGEVIQGRYKTSRRLQQAGIISGRDITMEAAITKMMYLVGKKLSYNSTIEALSTPLAGEMKGKAGST